MANLCSGIEALHFGVSKIKTTKTGWKNSTLHIPHNQHYPDGVLIIGLKFKHTLLP